MRNGFRDRDSGGSRPASTSVLLGDAPNDAAAELARRPSAAVVATVAAADFARRPSAVVPVSPALRRPSVNPAHIVASQQRFMMGLMQERCSALRASLSGLSGRSAHRHREGDGGGGSGSNDDRRPPKKRSAKIGDDALTAILSAIYAKTLVVLGIAFPVTEILSRDVPIAYYQGFYLYLYVGSIGFMCFMYAALLKDRAVSTIIRMHSAFPSGSSEKDFDSAFPPRRRSLTPVVRYGSFYLRLGAIAFGIGSMVYSGLEFGQYFELKKDSACHNVLQALNPATRMVLTLLQMQFIFLNSKDMKMWRHKVVARFGLMHTIACNLCEWLYVLVEETRHEILHLQSHHGDDVGHGGDHTSSSEEDLNETHPLDADEECRRSNIIGLLVQDASPFLFPCTIEYSLICAVLLYEMWKNVRKPTPAGNASAVLPGQSTSGATTRPSSTTGDENEDDSNDGKEDRRSKRQETTLCQIDNVSQHHHQLLVYLQQNHQLQPRSHHHFSVDCAGAHKGLFVGILVLVLTIISLILFFVLSKDPDHKEMAVFEVNVTELILYIMCTICVVWGMVTMRELKYHRKGGRGKAPGSSSTLGLDNTLLLIAQTGMYIYCMFSIIGCYFTEGAALGLVAEFFSLVQTTAQTVFVLDAWSRRTRTVSQARRKPGRQLITFLLVANMSMWSINTLEKGQASFRPSHLEFFGDWAWTIITHVSMPLAIFYRFHSTICLFEIWKNAYKFKPHY